MSTNILLAYINTMYNQLFLHPIAIYFYLFTIFTLLFFPFEYLIQYQHNVTALMFPERRKVFNHIYIMYIDGCMRVDACNWKWYWTNVIDKNAWMDGDAWKIYFECNLNVFVACSNYMPLRYVYFHALFFVLRTRCKTRLN